MTAMWQIASFGHCIRETGYNIQSHVISEMHVGRIVEGTRCDVIWEVLQPSQRELRQYLWTEEGSHMDRACPEQWGTKTTPCVDPIYLRGLHRTNISKTLHFTTFRAQLHVWQLCLRLMFRDRWTLWSGYRLPRGSRIDTPTHPSIGAVAIPLPSDF